MMEAYWKKSKNLALQLPIAFDYNLALQLPIAFAYKILRCFQRIYFMHILKSSHCILSNSSNPFSILPHFSYLFATFCWTIQVPFSILLHFVYMSDMEFTMRTFDKVHIGLNLYGDSYLVLKHPFLHRVNGY